MYFLCNPVFDSDIWKNTAERLILYSFSGGAFSFGAKFIVINYNATIDISIMLAHLQ